VYRRIAVLAGLLTLAFATGVNAECDHVSSSCPNVANWHIEGHAGGFTLSMTLLQNSPTHQDWARLFDCATCGDDGRWGVALGARLVGASGYYSIVPLAGVAVTDSTFRVDVAYPAGDYEYIADVDGFWPGENDFCPSLDTLGVFSVPSATPARAASWGDVKRRWGRP